MGQGHTGHMDIVIKRAYEEAEASDGYRVLVERLWPRGVTKERAHLDEWLKDIAPSPELRRWWNHDSTIMHEFARRYRLELEEGEPEKAAVAHLRETAAGGERVTLIYAAHDPLVNGALVLRDYLLG